LEKRCRYALPARTVTKNPARPNAPAHTACQIGLLQLVWQLQLVRRFYTWPDLQTVNLTKIALSRYTFLVLGSETLSKLTFAKTNIVPEIFTKNSSLLNFDLLPPIPQKLTFAPPTLWLSRRRVLCWRHHRISMMASVSDKDLYAQDRKLNV